MQKTTASQVAKAYGLKSLTEAAKMTELSTVTLRNWYLRKYDLFLVVILGCVVKKQMKGMQQIIGFQNVCEKEQIIPARYVLSSMIGRQLACTALTIGVALTSQSGGTVTMPSLTVTGVTKSYQPIHTTLLIG